ADVRDGAGPAGDGPAGGRGAVAACPSRGQRGGPGPNRPGREHGGEGRGMSMGRKLRAGVIGLGMVGRPQALNLIALQAGAVVAVPTQFHRDVALRLAEAGVHTLVEKPLAFDIGEAEEITAAFEHAGLVGAVGYIERYNPALQEMRRRIADGQLGEIYQIATRRQGGFPARIADVGVVKDLATHDLDLTAWVS